MRRYLQRLGIRDGRDLWARLKRMGRGLRSELVMARRICADRRSTVRLGLDLVGYRLLGIVNIGGGRRRRHIRLRSGSRIAYRLNRGDIRIIAELWQLDLYRLAPNVRAPVIVDVGANIGAVSLYLAERHGARYVLAVEPSPDNAALTRLNLEANAIQGRVLQAAVGGANGTARFAEDRANSAVGQVADTGYEVEVMSMARVLEHVPEGERVGVLKLDAEGAEREIFAAEDVSWLSRVDLIVAELHPNLVQVDGVFDRLHDSGFDHVVLDRHPRDWLYGDVMVLFSRPQDGDQRRRSSAYADRHRCAT